MPKKDTAKAETGISFQDIYDILMYQIEPDLVTSVIPYLPEILEKESNEERSKLIARYKKALETFLDRFESLMEEWKESVQAIKRTIAKHLEEESEEKTTEKLSQIEKDIENN